MTSHIHFLISLSILLFWLHHTNTIGWHTCYDVIKLCMTCHLRIHISNVWEIQIYSYNLHLSVSLWITRHKQHKWPSNSLVYPFTNLLMPSFRVLTQLPFSKFFKIAQKAGPYSTCTISICVFLLKSCCLVEMLIHKYPCKYIWMPPIRN